MLLWPSLSCEVETEGCIMTRTVQYFRALSVSNKITSRNNRYYRCLIYLKRLSRAKKFYILVFLPGSMSFWWMLKSLGDHECKTAMWLTRLTSQRKRQYAGLLNSKSLVREPLPAVKRKFYQWEEGFAV